MNTIITNDLFHNINTVLQTRNALTYIGTLRCC